MWYLCVERQTLCEALGRDWETGQRSLGADTVTKQAGM